MNQAVWIKDACVLSLDAKRAVYQASLRIENGVITDILKKPLPKSVERDRKAKMIHAENRVVMPGFVQAHVHLCQTLFRNMADDLELMDWLSKKIWVFESRHTFESLKISALLGIHELLASGTTCILDMGTVKHTDAIFEAVQETGIRASVGKCLMDNPKTTPPSLRERTSDALTEALLLYQKWNGKNQDRIRVSYAPRFVISCTEELLREVARASREQGATVHTHASENLKEIQRVKELVQCENIEYLHQLGFLSDRLVLAHCIWLKPNEMKLLKQSGTHVAHCPSSNLKLASGIAHIPEMKKMGINVALGADGAPCNNNLNMFQEMKLAALIHKPQGGPRVMRATEVLEMATLGGAKALGWQKQIGSIEIGKRADLICLDLERSHTAVAPGLASASYESLASTVVYSAQSSNIDWTMVDGDILYSKGRVRGISETHLIEQARKSLKDFR